MGKDFPNWRKIIAPEKEFSQRRKSSHNRRKILGVEKKSKNNNTRRHHHYSSHMKEFVYRQPVLVENYYESNVTTLSTFLKQNIYLQTCTD